MTWWVNVDQTCDPKLEYLLSSCSHELQPVGWVILHHYTVSGQALHGHWNLTKIEPDILMVAIEDMRVR
jgi:hypothetical protein